jgi:hypothetical protein
MRLKITLIILSLSCLTILGFSQLVKKDTLYYLLDTLRTPRNDQMMVAHIFTPTNSARNAKRVFVIDCSCLKPDGGNPTFEALVRYEKTVGQEFFNSLRLTSISSVIKHAIDNDSGNKFNEKYVFYVLTPSKSGEYLLSRTIFTSPTRHWNTTN